MDISTPIEIIKKNLTDDAREALERFQDYINQFDPKQPIIVLDDGYTDRHVVRLGVTLNDYERYCVESIIQAAGWANVNAPSSYIEFYFPSHFGK